MPNAARDPTPPRGDDGNDRDPRTAALLGLIVILVLAIGSIVLVRALRTESQREDCLMSGRRNCAPIEVPARPYRPITAQHFPYGLSMTDEAYLPFPRTAV